MVNDALHAVDDINRKIASLVPKGVDVTGLQDERQRIIDGIASIVPVRTVKREHDQVALYSANGGVLLDGKVFELAFDKAANVVTPDMSVGAGLGALMQDQGAAGGPVAVAPARGGLFDGGSLAALFEVRDRIVPEFDGEVDRYANDLIERFRDLMPANALDASGEGLFVDGGPGGLTGLAGRIEINAAVDPNAGGAVWRLRDGLDAAMPGAEGDGTTLQALGGRDDGGARPARLRLAERPDRVGDDGVRDRLVLRRPRRAQRRGPGVPGGAAGGALRAGDPRGRRRQRRRARVADAGRAGLRRQRPGAVGDRRPDEAVAGGLRRCA